MDWADIFSDPRHFANRGIRTWNLSQCDFSASFEAQSPLCPGRHCGFGILAPGCDLDVGRMAWHADIGIMFENA